MEDIMKKSLLLLISLFFSITIFSQTPVPAGAISGTWTLAGSPYQIQGETTILDSTTLTIEPGVLVEWQGSYAMQVQGQILAIGTVTDSIIFTAADTATGFKGVRFLETPPSNDTSRFEYCIFKYGRAHGPYPDNNGGAIATKNYSKLIVEHCLFAENKAIEVNVVGPSGGAIALWTSGPIIRNSTFINNESHNGGAIMCYEESCPLIESNVFNGNTAIENPGPGIAYGGVIMCYIYSDPLIRNNTFINNRAYDYGGAISCLVNCYPQIEHNLFYNNTAQMDGGAIRCYFNSDPLIRNNTFTNNLAYRYGGAISCKDSCNPQIEHNLFYNNTAQMDGGAIDLESNCLPEIINNTIVNNVADSVGGGISLYDECSPRIENTILWGNTAAMGSQVYIYDADCVPDFYYSNIQYGLDSIGGVDSTGDYDFCINADPLFSQLGDFKLSWTNFAVDDTTKSPCIDTGDPNSPKDPDSTICDMGAYYFDQMPEIPLALNPPNHTSTSFEADWTSTYGALGYNLEVAYDNAFSSYVPGYDPMQLNDTTSWYDVTGLSMDTEYYYRVSAFNTACTGDYSNSVLVSYVSVTESNDKPINIFTSDNQIYLENSEKITSESYVLVFNSIGQLLAQQSLKTGTNLIPSIGSDQIAIVKVVLNKDIYLEKVLLK